MSATGVPMVTLSGGAAIPLLGIGTWQARGGDAYTAVKAALEIGYRHIDTATMYRNEEEVGRAVREGGIDRGDIFITTKLPADAADKARHTIEESLRLMGVDYVDLWLIHWPPNGKASPKTWRHLLDARDQGLTHEVGVSNYSIAQIDELEAATGERPTINQIEWGPSLYDSSVASEHERRGVVLEGYSPFRSTNLDDSVLTSIADRYDKSSAQVVLRWHLQHGFVAIPKSTHTERIAANFDVFDFELTAGEIAEIDGMGVSD